MRRQGKYTKTNKKRSAKLTTRQYFLWFRNMKRWQKFLTIATPIVVILLIIPLLTYAYFARDIADQERLMNRNNTGIVIVDRNGKEIYRTGRSRHRDIVPLNKISKHTQNALLASEDKDFYDHGGFSVKSMLAALYGDIISGDKKYGGSTITQQLAKNTLLSNKKTFLRKYQELSIAIAIEQTYSKDEILDMYLNSVYFGGSCFGIEDAASLYFDKKPKDLDLAESTLLIGILPAPNSYSPIFGNEKYAKERQAVVLSRMVDNNMITEKQKNKALKEKLHYASQESDISSSPAPHFSHMVIDKLKEMYGDEKVARSGLQVKTTLDLDKQKELNQIIDNNMNNLRMRGGSNAAAVELDPRTGEIIALVGSYDWNNKGFGQVNMAITSRQPGSSFKPIYYSEALAEGVITPATLIKDEATDFNGYKPHNALKRYYGEVTVRKALDWSLNIPAVKVMDKLGIDKSVSTARKLGLNTIKQDKDYGLSLALGSAGVRLIDMVHAYSSFANHGKQMKVRMIDSVDNKYDKTIYKSTPQSKQVISPQGAYLISNILSDNSARAGMFGSALNIPGKKVAVKTGTTDESRDGWTIGYTPQVVIGVWTGNNDDSPMKSEGVSTAGPIWRRAMISALSGVSDVGFSRPDGIVERLVCYGTGKLASHPGENTYKDVFLATAMPPYGCNVEEKEEPKDEDKTSDSDKKEETNKSDEDTQGTDDSNTEAGEDNSGDSSSSNDDSNGGSDSNGSGDSSSGQSDSGSGSKNDENDSDSKQ